MTELEAALGLGELDKAESMVKSRHKNAWYLYENLEDLLKFPIKNYIWHSFMFFPVYADYRDKLMVCLEKHGIQTRTMMPLISQPITKPYLKRKYPNAEY